MFVVVVHHHYILCNRTRTHTGIPWLCSVTVVMECCHCRVMGEKGTVYIYASKQRMDDACVLCFSNNKTTNNMGGHQRMCLSHGDDVLFDE